MFQYVAILLCVLGLAADAYADDTTVRLFNAQHTMAQRGNAQAQYYLGEMYELGLGTAEDTEQAIKWYRKAAAQNHPMAKRKLQELTTVTPAAPAQANVEAPAPVVAPLPQAAPPPKATVSAKPAAKSKENENAAKEADVAREIEAARAAEAKRAAAAARQARAQAEAKAKQEAAAKERRRILAEAALARMKADAKKNGIGY